MEVGAGFCGACGTAVGSGLPVTNVGGSAPVQAGRPLKALQRDANLGIGFGLLFLIAGRVIGVLGSVAGDAWIVVAPILSVLGIVFWLFGCVKYAQSKGYSGAVGALGLLWLIGLLVLAALPNRLKQAQA